MTEEALKLALEALENNRQAHHYCEDTWYSCPKHEDGCANDAEGDECNCGADKANAEIDAAITAIKEALANEALEKMAENARELGLDYEPAQTEQHQDWCASLTQMLMSMPPKPAPCNCKPKPKPMAWIDKMVIDVPNKVFYTAPRTWVGLTEEEILSISADCAATHQHTDIHFARAIEAALKAKNT